MGELAERTAPIFQVLIQAAGAEPEMAELLERFEDQRLAAATRIATEVRARGGLPPGRSFDDARDVIWMCSAPEISTMLVGKRGWTTARYVDWARDALVQLVSVPPTGGRR